MRSHHGDHHRPHLCPACGRRQRRPLGPRAGSGLHPESGRRRHGPGLQDPGPVQAAGRGRLYGRAHRRTRRQCHRPGDRRQGHRRVRPAEGRTHVSEASAQEALRTVERTGHRPPGHRPGSGGGHAPHPHGRRPGRRAHSGPGPALLPLGRLGRLHDGHGLLGHSLWHAQPAWSPRSIWACSRTTRST